MANRTRTKTEEITESVVTEETVVEKTEIKEETVVKPVISNKKRIIARDIVPFYSRPNMSSKFLMGYLKAGDVRMYSSIETNATGDYYVLTNHSYVSTACNVVSAN